MKNYLENKKKHIPSELSSPSYLPPVKPLVCVNSPVPRGPASISTVLAILPSSVQKLDTIPSYKLGPFGDLGECRTKIVIFPTLPTLSTVPYIFMYENTCKIIYF